MSYVNLLTIRMKYVVCRHSTHTFSRFRIDTNKHDVSLRGACAWPEINYLRADKCAAKQRSVLYRIFEFKRFGEEWGLRLSVTATSTLLAVSSPAGKCTVTVGALLLYARCQEFTGRTRCTFSMVYRGPETMDASGNNGQGTKHTKQRKGVPRRERCGRVRSSGYR